MFTLYYCWAKHYRLLFCRCIGPLQLYITPDNYHSCFFRRNFHH